LIFSVYSNWEATNYHEQMMEDRYIEHQVCTSMLMLKQNSSRLGGWWLFCVWISNICYLSSMHITIPFTHST